MDEEEILDLISDLEEMIQANSDLMKTANEDFEINNRKGQITAYQDCIVRLQEYIN